MANQVTFQIKIETLGAENVKNVTMDAEELGRVVHEVTDEQEKLNAKLLDINQAQQAIQNVVSGISQIASEIRTYTSAYALQETAEAKVAQVMRNTMAASDAEIESIKALCSAQQELGVIGDEVQLAGAQELATYLEKKSSLEQLLPVMNDMLAQQYGLEASQESAAQIATMLGKVMEGQTSALSRYGYSFDEAQEKVLKFGTEEERAAVLAEVVSQSVGGMNEALRQTPTGQLKAAENTLGDIQEQVGACLVYLEPFVSKLDAAGRTVGSLTSLANGATGVARALRLTDVTQKAWHATSVTTTAVVRTLTSAMRGGAVGATTLRVAIRGLMVATGVGAAIAALTFIVEQFVTSSNKASDAANDLSKAQNEETAQLQQTRAALEINIAKLKDFHGSKEQEKKIVEEMNDTYGETMGYFSSVAEWYNALVKNSDAYCRQMVIEARTRMLANQIAEKEQEIHDLKYDETGKARQYSTQREYRREEVSIQSYHMGMSGGTRPTDVEIPGTSELDKATAKVKKGRDAVADLQKQLRDLVRESATIKLPVIGSGTPAASTPRTGQAARTGRGVGAAATERVNLSGLTGMNLGNLSAEIDLTPRLDEDEVQKEMGNLNWAVEMEVDAQGMKRIEAEAEKARKKFDFATESVESLGGSLAGLGEAIGVPELNVAGIVAQSIATMVQGYAQATAEASTMGPWAWVAFGALGLAQLTAMITSVKNLTKFADGGVAYGPTLGLFGEYANAATNPEVVAPLDRLRALIGSDGGSGPEVVEFRMRGRDLVGVSEKRNRLLRRT